MRLHISSGLQPSLPILAIIFPIMFAAMRGIALVMSAIAIPPAIAPITAARMYPPAGDLELSMPALLLLAYKTTAYGSESREKVPP